MILPKEQLLYTLLLVVIMIIISLIIKKAIRKFSFVQAIEINRRKVIFNICYFIIYLFSGFILAIIWGVKFQEFTIFISSVLAVLGVGFFAQWSILSNLTASFILFFYHPIRIGHRIKIIDKDYNWVGEVKNITAFYFFIETDAGENISLPNSLVMQKGIEILAKEASVQKEQEELYKE
ncbi:mechanosensitive ion channel [Kordia sp. YSTF-M3]|uniref:Mechanosensitive ion channel n=1 Tax=Kordia aestuariivivens TaxID=2759037 RepID=A0ABR7Q3L9_9FLAO|nr:mechanosensitive ion channel domain-containing protein [Kordia aestuariivivens]MBC8753140.1 mechanosensitive ion channel [Kordia aestuariivivens]